MCYCWPWQWLQTKLYWPILEKNLLCVEMSRVKINFYSMFDLLVCHFQDYHLLNSNYWMLFIFRLGTALSVMSSLVTWLNMLMCLEMMKTNFLYDWHADPLKRQMSIASLKLSAWCFGERGGVCLTSRYCLQVRFIGNNFLLTIITIMNNTSTTAIIIIIIVIIFIIIIIN